MHRLIIPSLFFVLAPLTAAELPAEGFVCAGHSGPQVQPGVAAKPLGGATGGVATQGRVNVLVIFARFKDETPKNQTIPAYAADLFNPDLPGSFSHFYHTMSFGQLQVQGTVLPRRYSSEQPAAAYLTQEQGKDGQYGQFVLEVLRQADGETDFGLFDNDGPDGLPDSGDDDGFVDYVFVNVQSAPPGFLRGRATGVAGLGFNKPYTSQDTGWDGRAIRLHGVVTRGVVQQEGSFAQTVGVMAHEFGHSLGLPDLYDLAYGNPSEDSAGIGAWGLMGWGAHGWNEDDGPNPLCAWSREQLGWIGVDNEQLVEVAQDAAGLVLEDLQAGGSVVKISLRPVSNQAFSLQKEYLLLEHLTRSGSYYQRHLPGEGLLVWHIRPQASGNKEEGHKLVDLICADGLYQDAGYPLGQRADIERGLDNLDFWAHDAGYLSIHGGNRGDATDPFDGVRFTRFDLGTNPSSNPQGLTSAASTGIVLEMRRQDQAMQVDLLQPRWAGTIKEEVHWAGPIWVDGDLSVAAQGALVIHDDTRVRLAGTDRLHRGVDPARCELEIQGALRIRQDNAFEKVIFEALNPGEQWYGILLNPDDASRILLPAGAYELRDAEQGLSFPGAPTGAWGVQLSRFHVGDSSALDTAGNGDGRPGPGESFHLAIEVDNWSLAEYEDVQASLSWNSSLVYPTWGALPTTGKDLALPGTLALYAGGGHRFHLPALTLDPGAQAGEQIEFVFTLAAGSKTWRDTLSFAVAGSYPVGEARFEVPGFELRASSVLVPSDRGTSIQAHVQGPVDAVDLVVWSPSQGIAVLEIPMALQSTRGEEQVFEAEFRPPATDQYQLRLRLRSLEGTVVFGRDVLHVWGVLSSEPSAALVFLGEGKEALRPALTEVLARMELTAQILVIAPEEGLIYPLLLPHYLDEDKLVLWFGGRMDALAQTAFRDFLERGGRLLLNSLMLAESPNIQRLWEDLFHIKKAYKPSAGTLRSLYPNETIEFYAPYTRLELLAPAEPVVLNIANQAAGLRLDTGTYRLVYLPFELHGRQEAVRRPLFESSLLFLHQREVRGVELAVPGYEEFGPSLVVGTEQRVSVQARVEGAVEAADLIVRSMPQLEFVLELPMRQVAHQEGQYLFETVFQPPPIPGWYQVSLRLRSAAEEWLFSSTNLEILSLLTERPVLVMLGNQYGTAKKKALRTMFGETASALGLDAAFLDLMDADEHIYETLLGQHLDEGELVIWLGGKMEVEVQEVFRRFLERGGNLLLISYDLGRSPKSAAFRKEILHTSRITPAPTWKVRSLHLDKNIQFELPHSQLDPLPPAEPMLLNKKDKAAGLWVDTGTYRLAYLPFDLPHLQRAIYQPLIESALRFLRQQNMHGVELTVPGHEMLDDTLTVDLGQEARLEVQTIVGPVAIMPLRPFAPQIVVANTGEQSLDFFRAGYQILQGDQVVATFETDAALLEGRAQRTLLLPRWEPLHEGMFHIRFGLSPTREEALVYWPAQPLHMVAVPNGFEEVALEGEVSKGNGASFFDYDGDGDLDLYLVRRGGANRLFHNDGTGMVETAAAGLARAGDSRGLAVGDYDGDGDLDLYLVNEEANNLFRNEGEGTFVDRTSATGASLADEGSGRSAGFFDCDGDGDLDLYLVNAMGVNRLYRRDEGSFSEQAAAAGLDDAGNGRGLGLGDYDGDGDVDLFVANTTGPSRLYRNEAGAFQDVTEALGLDLVGGEIGSVFGDWDNDGDLDLLVANENGLNQLFGNEAAVSFQQDRLYVGARSVGVAFFDYDNDGDLDLATTAVDSRAGGDELYQNDGDRLVPVGALLDLQSASEGRGISFGDFDQDGDVDLFIADVERSRLYRNRADRGHWVQLDLAGPNFNRHGLGTRVELVTQGKHQMREVQSGYGYGSQVQPRLHFGLGAAGQIDTLRVRWPDGLESIRTDISADQYLMVPYPRLTTAVVEEVGEQPGIFQLQPNYPNPFNTQTIISYQVPQKRAVKLTVYNMAGQPVKRLAQEVQSSGSYQVVWDGRDDHGRPLATGVYLYRLQADAQTETRKLLLLR